MKMEYEYRKNKEKEIEDIQKLLKEKELELTKDPKIERIKNEISMLQNEFKNILQEEIEKNTTFLKQKYLMGANKAGKFMASLIKKRRAKTIVMSIK